MVESSGGLQLSLSQFVQLHSASIFIRNIENYNICTLVSCQSAKCHKVVCHFKLVSCQVLSYWGLQDNKSRFNFFVLEFLLAGKICYLADKSKSMLQIRILRNRACIFTIISLIKSVAFRSNFYQMYN